MVNIYKPQYSTYNILVHTHSVTLNIIFVFVLITILIYLITYPPKKNSTMLPLGIIKHCLAHYWLTLKKKKPICFGMQIIPQGKQC